MRIQDGSPFNICFLTLFIFLLCDLCVIFPNPAHLFVTMALKNLPKRKSVKPNAALEAVTEQLRTYATRGVFREFAVKPLTARSAEFRFTWLTSRRVRAKYDAGSSLLTLIDLLPDITPRSEMDRALRAFVLERFSAKLPSHRRISRALVRKLTFVNRRRAMSVRLTLNKKEAGEGAQQAVRLVSEIFQNFLSGPYHDYLVRNFELRED